MLNQWVLHPHLLQEPPGSQGGHTVSSSETLTLHRFATYELEEHSLSEDKGDREDLVKNTRKILSS